MSVDSKMVENQEQVVVEEQEQVVVEVEEQEQEQEQVVVELQDTVEKPKNRNKKRKLNKMADNNGHAIANAKAERLIKKIKLSLTKPSSLLRLDPRIGSKFVRPENRARLFYLLRKLAKRRNWKEVGGVLSVLLKGSPKDRSPVNNRLKYSVCLLFCPCDFDINLRT